MDRFTGFQKMMAMEWFGSKFKKSAIASRNFMAKTYNSIASFCDAPIDQTNTNQNCKTGIIEGISVDIVSSDFNNPLPTPDRGIIIKAFSNIRQVQTGLRSKQFIGSEDYDEYILEAIHKGNLKISGLLIQKDSHSNNQFWLYCDLLSNDSSFRLDAAIDANGNYTKNLSPTFT